MNNDALEENKEPPVIPAKKGWGKKILNGLGWLLLLLIMLFIALYLLIQTEKFQDWAVPQVTEYLSKELHTNVSIKKLNIRFFDKLSLEAFFIADESKDTLIYSKELLVGLNSGLYSLISGNIDLGAIYLIDAQVNLKRAACSEDYNFQYILDYFSKPKPKEKQTKPSILLDIDDVYLENVKFEKKDSTGGEHIFMHIRRGNIAIDTLDLASNRFIIKKADLEEIDFQLTQMDRFPVQEGECVLLPEEEFVPPIPDGTKQAFYLEVHEILVDNSRFKLDNFRKSSERKEQYAIDFDHLDVFDIHLAIDTFRFCEMVFEGQVYNISLKEAGGFEVSRLSSTQAYVSSRKMDLEGLRLETPFSNLGDHLVFKYKAFGDFEKFHEAVYMTGDFVESKVALKDIMRFAAALENNPFFSKNRDEIFELDGILKGKVENLKGRDLNIKLGDRFSFKGNFSSRNLNVRNEELLNLKVEQVQTSIATLRQLVPGFDPPPNFDKLGSLNFSGLFDGFFTDFVADGRLVTDLGTASMDMRLDLKNGREKAQYYGQLNLRNFDLAKWTDNNQLGKVTFSSEVNNGIGLTGKTVNADLGANIESFTFRGYTYENLQMEGKLNQNLFDGDFSIKDDNIDFGFSGTIDLQEKIPIFDFKANIHKLDLKALNLIKDNLVIAGNLDLFVKDKDLASIHGKAQARNIRIIHNDTSLYKIDSLSLSSKFGENGDRLLQLNSEILNAAIQGQYDIGKIPNLFLDYAHRNFPVFSQKLKLKAAKQSDFSNQVFHFNANIIDSKNLGDLIDPKLDTLKDISLKGNFDSYKDSLFLEVQAASFQYDNVFLEDIYIKTDLAGNAGILDLGVFKTVINNKTTLAPISALSLIYNDTIDFNISAYDFSSLLDNLDLNGLFFIHDDLFQVSFASSNMVFLNEVWDIDDDNYLRFGKGKIETKNFDLKHKSRELVLESLGDQGLSFAMNNFPLGYIDSIWNYRELDFYGNFNASLDVENIFNLEGLTASIVSDTFIINGDDWGLLRLDAKMGDIKSPASTYLAITKGNEQLTAEGIFNPPGSRDKTMQPLYFNFDVNIDDFPVGIARYWIGDQVSNITGQFNSNLKIEGVPKLPNISGWINIYNSGLTIDYLGTRYYIDNDTAFVNNYMFDATGATIRDSLGNYATVTGGITHDHLKHLGLNVSAYSKKFLFLDTKKDKNKLYYGYAIGEAEVSFTGNFKQTDIAVDARTGPGTRIVIPVSYEQTTKSESFIKFINKNKKQPTITIDEIKKKTELRGINLDMKLDITEDTEGLLVFDEQAGDIIKGRGEGTLQVKATRSGEFDIYGVLTVRQGEYLFTLYNVVNKPFVLNKEGTITWSGDPFGAELNITADYNNLSTSPYYFIEEYVAGASEDIKSQAQQATPVDLSMHLTGPLLKPNINFDLGFPKLDGELENFADSKMQIVRLNQNELNRQVFGLLVIGGFLPSGNISGSQFVTGINTLTELLSNQLSIYFTELLTEAFTDVGFISGVDFDVAYNVYGAGLENDKIQAGSELQVRLKNNLFNDRLSINVGSNFDFRNSQNNTGTYIAGDVVIEYVLTKDRRFKIRFYQSSEPNIQGGRRGQTGIGLSYRREFESWKSFIKGFKKDAKKVLR